MPIAVWADFYLTDGTSRVNLLELNQSRAGIGVSKVNFSRPQRDTDSIFARRYKTIQEGYKIRIGAPSQDQAIAYIRGLEAILLQAENFMLNDYEFGIVWLVSRAARETNTRYAVVYGGAVSEYADIYDQPFIMPSGESIMDDLDLGITRGAWLANPPLSPPQKTVLSGTVASTINVIDNRFTTNPLVSVKVFDTSAGTYTTFAAPTYPAGSNLVPTPPGVGDILYLGFNQENVGTSYLPSTVYFNVVTAAVGITFGVWQYWNGAGWANIDYQKDNTAGLTVSGSLSYTMNTMGDIWVGTTVNGVVANWLRVSVTALPGGVHTPPKVNLIYQPKNYIEVSNVKGDIPALADITMYNRAYLGTTIANQSQYTGEVIVGVRSTDRGANFFPWLPPELATAPPHATVSSGNLYEYSTNGRYFATNPYSQYEAVVQYQTTGVTIDGVANSTLNYYGTFRAFLRARYTGVSTNLSMRLVKKVNAGLGVTINTYGPEIIPVSPTIPSYLMPIAFDMGQFTIGPRDIISTAERGGDCRFEVEVKCDPVGEVIWLFDLFLLPIDEWAGTFTDSNHSYSSVGNVYKFQSASYQKRQTRAVTSLVGSETVIIDQWRSSVNGPIILTPGKTQRIYFLTGVWNSNFLGCSIGHPHEIKLFVHERFLGMRGNG